MAEATKLSTEKQARKELGDPEEWAIYQERKLVRAKRVDGSFEVNGEKTDQGFLVIDEQGVQQGVCISEFQRRFRPVDDSDMRTLTEQPIAEAAAQRQRDIEEQGNGSRGFR